METVKPQLSDRVVTNIPENEMLVTHPQMPLELPVSPDEIPEIPDRVFFRIGEVSDIVGVKPYVLRYWESEFSILSPGKSQTGQRLYKKSEVETLLMIKHLLYKERYSIEGARKRIRELRKDGGIATFKKQKILGGEKQLKAQEKMKALRRAAEDLDALIRKPVHEFFKF